MSLNDFLFEFINEKPSNKDINLVKQLLDKVKKILFFNILINDRLIYKRS